MRRLEVDGVDWISPPGRVTRKQLRDLHWRSHVFVSAARLEAFGIAALEARTAGLALVVREGTGRATSCPWVCPGCSPTPTTDWPRRSPGSPPDRPCWPNCNSTTVASPAEDWPTVVKSTVAEYRRAQQQATVR